MGLVRTVQCPWCPKLDSPAPPCPPRWPSLLSYLRKSVTQAAQPVGQETKKALGDCCRKDTGFFHAYSISQLSQLSTISVISTHFDQTLWKKKIQKPSDMEESGSGRKGHQLLFFLSLSPCIDLNNLWCSQGSRRSKKRGPGWSACHEHV